jgi:hypothetical protein
MYKIALVLISAVLLFTGISGCGGSGSESEVEVPDYVHTLVEELLEAFKVGDYTAYLEHFEAGADWVMPEDYFSQQVSFIQKKIGHYISMSKELSEVKVTEKYTDVIYKTRFSSEPDDVIVTVSYYISDNRVYAEGIWFNSPRLRGQ